MEVTLVKKCFIFLLSLCLIAGLAGCGGTSEKAANTDGKLKVAVSFDAMRESVQAVGGDKVSIIEIIPDGTEPHEFQPTAKRMKLLHDANVFVMQGLGMEPWAEAMIKAADNPKLVVVEAGTGVSAITNTDEDEIKEHGQYDPHAWLSPSCAQIEVQNIADGLAKADPKNAGYYQANAKAYKEQLQALQNEYTQKFSALPHKDFVTGHAAFAYLCRDFGLEQKSVESVFAAGEPTTNQMKELVDYCRDNHVKTIFSEELVSPKTSETLAREVGAKVQPIHTMESSEGGATYLDRMKENLQRIYESLQ